MKKRVILFTICLLLFATSGCQKEATENNAENVGGGHTTENITGNTMTQTEESSPEESTEPNDAQSQKEYDENVTSKEPSSAEEPATWGSTAEPESQVSAGALDVLKLAAGTTLSEEFVGMYGEDAFFAVLPISDDVFFRMEGNTFKDYSPVSREELRYIKCLHRDLEGVIKVGEVVMHESVADDICEIFHALYRAWYPIEKMHLADDYNADDEASMTDNNTSGFNVRYVEFTETLCNHAYGTAIDINPFYNVYYIPDMDVVFPAAAYEYKNRDIDFPYKLEEGDLCYQLFTERGFSWGGFWGAPDYQHFEKIR